MSLPPAVTDCGTADLTRSFRHPWLSGVKSTTTDIDHHEKSYAHATVSQPGSTQARRNASAGRTHLGSLPPDKFSGRNPRSIDSLLFREDRRPDRGSRPS